MYKCKARPPIEIVTSPEEIDDKADVDTADVKRYMERMLNWADEINARVKENMKAQESRRKFSMPNTDRLPLR